MTTSKIQALQQQLGHVNLLLDDARKKEKAVVLAAIHEQVKQYGITELELLRAAGFVKDKPKKLPAKNTTIRHRENRGRDTAPARNGWSTKTWTIT
ncbi:H-NS histone family protein [Burkholderia pseudomallei]|nr:H-NS histone family protein [Burkholderia pseudomallei]